MAHFTRSGSSPWNLTVRDIDLNEIEHANGYARLRMDLRDSDVGEWSLRLKSNHPAVPYLLQPGSGLVVRPIGHTKVAMSGFSDEIFLTESRDSEIGFLTVSGFTDTALFTDLAYPDPSTDVSQDDFSTFAATHDERSGPAETVLKEYVSANIGPSAGIARRRYSFLNIPVSAGLGARGSWRARFHSLLELCRDIATYGGLSFRIVQTANGELTLQTWLPADRPEVRFSTRAQNLSSAVLIRRAPNTSELIMGADGEGAARNFALRIANGRTRLDLDGSEGTYASTPNRPEFHTTQHVGDDLVVTVDAIHPTWDPASEETMASIYDDTELEGGGTVNNRAWRVSLVPGGFVLFRWSPDGDNNTEFTTSVAVPAAAGERLAVRVWLNTDNGGDHSVSVKTAPTSDDSFSSLDVKVFTGEGTTSVFDSSADLIVGARANGTRSPFSGTILKMTYWDGNLDGNNDHNSGELVADVDFTAQEFGAQEFTDDTGLTWTLHGNARLRGVPDATGWGRRMAKFLDRRSLDTVDEVHGAADTRLLEDAVTAGMQLYPIEQPGTLYGVDYELGDRIPVVVQGVELVEPVRRVVITHEAGKPPDVVPSVGLPIGDGESPEDVPGIRTMLQNLMSLARS